MSEKNNACIVVDIKESEIKSFIDALDLGRRKYRRVVTESGKEVLSGQVPEGQNSVFYGQEFFQAIDTEHMQSSGEISYQEWIIYIFTAAVRIRTLRYVR